MVRRKSALHRAAFTMIELIFAIVVISIAVMSLPMMIQITSEGIEDNIVQEAIFAASAELMGATSYYWDLNSMQDNALSRLSRVIEVNGVCNDDRLRPGHVNQPYHRRCLDSNTTVVANTPDTNTPPVFPNLDNAENDAIGDLFDTSAAEAAGYKQEYQSQVIVTQATDSNIKVLTASIYTSDGATLLTRLRIYSANIGEVDYYKRRF
ncbi:MAG: prepilin-type N-terminal cleavage/methylation domain-containing protein [Sulfurimonas sp.]|uniref:type II secretion system protein n=1 Tax=Sulfurimonas sp. TaxID=2022749 RepID=UPI0028CF0A0E|nr:prepilin-type N-terminal cleavage/methylation domain-containing protein [Sulfurimonas sp.]MDT8338668.1 prepilin-type N-terminal cleavage/methylation domain-containing protein [Sulfurimonas sp.]